MNIFEEYLKLAHININDPKFDQKHTCHDWRNYVPDEWSKNWYDFSEREKIIIAVMAEQQAENEEWN